MQAIGYHYMYHTSDVSNGLLLNNFSILLRLHVCRILDGKFAQ